MRGNQTAAVQRPVVHGVCPHRVDSAVRQAGPLSDEGAGSGQHRATCEGSLTCGLASLQHREPEERMALWESREGEGPVPRPVAVPGMPVAGLLTQSSPAEDTYTTFSVPQPRTNLRPQLQRFWHVVVLQGERPQS
ncbi:hypothetical protein NDU88_006939 [Pleurodeles waltl]|uniref:Uncharacterized protein n=1 Tax=Pleurodeles waltl TaxID=8319 RepID=A0AAV7QN78_PLEWA|nr:hypothetical protein NDU88_006939 [Pleurodeles waltl]